MATISGAVSLDLAVWLVRPFTTAPCWRHRFEARLLASNITAGADRLQRLHHYQRVSRLLFTLGRTSVRARVWWGWRRVIAANRWLIKRPPGDVSAGNANGHFLSCNSGRRGRRSIGWRSVPWTVALVILLLMPVVMLLLAEEPATLGLAPFGGSFEAAQPPTQGNPSASRWRGWAGACDR